MCFEGTNMFNASSFLKYADFAVILVAFVGCRATNKASYLTPPGYSSNSPGNSVAPPGSPSSAVTQPSISLASTQDTDETRATRSIDPELIPYMPKEDKGLDLSDEYSPQAYSFGSSASSDYRSQGRSGYSGCTSGCCSH